MKLRLRFAWCGSRLLFTSVLVLALGAGAWAQNSTTGAISGTIKDPSGAVIPAATVTAVSVQDGSVHKAQSQVNGGYLIPLLQPGSYTVTVAHTGFQTSKHSAVAVSVTNNVSVNFTLTLGESSQTVEVTGQPPLLQPDNPNISTTLTTAAIANLPNPGNDLTFLAQVAPGATMTKNGSYYNTTYNGLPGTTSNFTVDGGSYNDPFLGINNSGPTNLSLGTNDISEVTVATNPYSVDQGHAEGANINYVSKRGGNNYHGNLNYQWNGRSLNAYDTFVQAIPVTPTSPLPAKPFDNVNLYAGSIGGPVMHNKLFFFVDDEGAQIDLPLVDTGNVPTAAYETYAEQQILVGGCETDNTYFNPTAGKGTAAATGNCAVSGASQPGVANGENGNYLYLPPQPAEAAFQKQQLDLYNVGRNTKLQLSPKAEQGCNLLADGTVDPNFNPQLAAGQAAGDLNQLPDDNGCTNAYTFSGSNTTWENKLIARADWTPSQANSYWFSYTNDRGLQATGLNPINNLFSENSFQPEFATNGGWTHVFSPNVVNDLKYAQTWYAAPFGYSNKAAYTIQPLQFSTPWGRFGSSRSVSGRNVTNIGLIDDISITKGTHQIKFGENFLREYITDFGGGIAPAISADDFAQLDYGVASSGSDSYTVNADLPVRLYSIEAYAGDTWQMTHNFNLTYGIRATNNSDPRQPYGLLGNPTDWELMNHGIGVSPASQIFSSTKLYNHVAFVFWQPRLAFAYQPMPNTLVSGGWGMFEAVAPADQISNLARNAPFNPSYSGGYSSGALGEVPTDGSAIGPSAAGCPFSAASSGQCGVLFDPSQANSIANAMALANQLFQTNYAAKALSCAAPGASAAACIPVQRLSIEPQQGLSEPYADEWSFGVTQQFGQATALSVKYVGNRSLHNGDTVDPNSYQSLCDGCFAPYTYSRTSPDKRFSSVSQYRFDGITTYNALQASLKQRAWHGLTLALNYNWAHAMQTGSPFSDASGLGATYRDQTGTPFNVVSANYSYTLPWHVQSKALGQIVNGWRISGATFSQGGDPLFVTSASMSSVVHQAAGPNNTAYFLGGVAEYSKNKDIAANNNDAGVYQWLNPAAFMSLYNRNTKSCVDAASMTYVKASAATCQYPATYAQHILGPGFQWTNFFLTKDFDLSERMKFEFDVQAYNLFNHPNLANPGTTAPVPGVASSFVNAGTIGSLDAPSTGLLGNFLGGDNAPRMVAFEGKITF